MLPSTRFTFSCGKQLLAVKDLEECYQIKNDVKLKRFGSLFETVVVLASVQAARSQDQMFPWEFFRPKNSGGKFFLGTEIGIGRFSPSQLGPRQTSPESGR